MTKREELHKEFGLSLAVRGVRVPKCRDVVLKELDLTPEQLAALHMCKHEIVAAIFRLYKDVPQTIADKLLSDFIKAPPRE